MAHANALEARLNWLATTHFVALDANAFATRWHCFIPMLFAALPVTDVATNKN